MDSGAVIRRNRISRIVFVITRTFRAAIEARRTRMVAGPVIRAAAWGGSDVGLAQHSVEPHRPR
jgi:hypothetical protein